MYDFEAAEGEVRFLLWTRFRRIPYRPQCLACRTWILKPWLICILWCMLHGGSSLSLQSSCFNQRVSLSSIYTPIQSRCLIPSTHAMSTCVWWLWCGHISYSHLLWSFLLCRPLWLCLSGSSWSCHLSRRLLSGMRCVVIPVPQRTHLHTRC